MILAWLINAIRNRPYKAERERANYIAAMEKLTNSSDTTPISSRVVHRRDKK